MVVTTGRHKGSQKHGPNVWKLSQGAGNRIARYRIYYGETYQVAPEIMIGITALNIDFGKKDRVDVKVEFSNSQYFILGYRTWGDTKITGVGINWMAIGQPSVSVARTFIVDPNFAEEISDQNAEGESLDDWEGWEPLEIEEGGPIPL